MHVRVRIFGKPDSIVVVESKLTKIEQFRRIIKDKFGVDIKLQRLLYGGKLLEDGYTFHDYNIKLNDVIQLMAKSEKEVNIDTNKSDILAAQKKVTKDEEEVINYKDAESTLYAVGDLIDLKDREQGAWFEGKIVRIVCDPNQPHSSEDVVIDDTKSCVVKASSDSENEPPTEGPSSESVSKSKQNGITKYFSKTTGVKKKQDKGQTKNKTIDHEGLLYKVQLDADEEDSKLYCSLTEIRPRARTVVDITDLKVGMTVMINHNTEDQYEKGYWYDFTVSEIKKLRTSYELTGTLYLGPDSIPQNDTKVKVHDKIFAIEDVVPLQSRTEEQNVLMVTQPEKRAAPLNCLTCRDDEDAQCKDCGCYLCSGKENPEKIVLCDECNNGYHMSCLNPPLTELPEEDWYCPSCRRDPNDVIAPGAAKQAKKSSATKSSRDWGRGMACVGKTKTCAMPANHFGPIPGIEVGMCWRFRIQLSESGVHRPPVSGIHGRDVEGAYSIVLSGGYEDDVDYGNEFTYTGSGGRDLSGNKRTAEQSCDQTLTRENKALARNCAVKQISDAGGDAGEDWRKGKPVRVVRSYKMLKHFPKYAPKEGIRYDGIYKVVKYYPEKGLSGFRVWKYLLRRDDPNPAPWEPGAKQYPIIYPDGYLEAEAEKKAQKDNLKVKKGGKKRALQESNRTSHSESEASPPGKKRKTSKNDSQSKINVSKNSSDIPSSEKKIPSIFKIKCNKKTSKSENSFESAITAEEKGLIEKDILNSILWQECLEVAEAEGKKEFVERVTQVFLCIICQEITTNPVTTPCAHNFCIRLVPPPTLKFPNDQVLETRTCNEHRYSQLMTAQINQWTTCTEGTNLFGRSIRIIMIELHLIWSYPTTAKPKGRACLKLAFKSTGTRSCPCCRQGLGSYEPTLNEELKAALQCVMPGYDAGKK